MRKDRFNKLSLTSSWSSSNLLSKSYFFFCSLFFCFCNSNRFFTWSKVERSIFMDIPRFRWSAFKINPVNNQTLKILLLPNSKPSLTFLSVDMVKKVDGVFDNTVADIAVITTRLSRWSVLRDDNWLPQPRVQIDPIIPLLQHLPLIWFILIFVFVVLHPFPSHLLVLRQVPFPTMVGGLRGN